MRTLLLFLACTLASGQTLRDIVASTDLPFTASGSPVNSYTVEFRFKANTSLNYIFGSPDISCNLYMSLLFCSSGVESNPTILPIVNGTDYRVRLVHDYDHKTNYLYLWTGDCVHAGQTYGIVPSQPLVVTGTWTVAGGQQLGFWRIYSGLTGSTSTVGGCPVDAPTTPADIFDFTFESSSGTAETTPTDRAHNWPMRGTFSEATLSLGQPTTAATYNPVAILTGSAPKIVGALSTTFPMSAENSRSFQWPGTGAPTSYTLTQTAGPGTCTITNGTTATPSANCNAGVAVDNLRVLCN